MPEKADSETYLYVANDSTATSEYAGGAVRPVRLVGFAKPVSKLHLNAVDNAVINYHNSQVIVAQETVRDGLYLSDHRLKLSIRRAYSIIISFIYASLTMRGRFCIRQPLCTRSSLDLSLFHSNLNSGPFQNPDHILSLGASLYRALLHGKDPAQDSQPFLNSCLLRGETGTARDLRRFHPPDPAVGLQQLFRDLALLHAQAPTLQLGYCVNHSASLMSSLSPSSDFDFVFLNSALSPNLKLLQCPSRWKYRYPPLPPSSTGEKTQHCCFASASRRSSAAAQCASQPADFQSVRQNVMQACRSESLGTACSV